MCIRKHLKCHVDEIFNGAAEVWVASTKNDVCPIKNLTLIAFGNAHHFANDLQWEWGGNGVNKIKFFIWSVFRKHLVHDGLGFVLYVLFNARNFLWRKALRHDGAQAHVFWVVHADHGAKEFVQLNREVGNVGALATAEQLWVAADMPNVVVLGESPIARPDREVGKGDFGEELYGGFAAQGGKYRFSVLAGALPKLRV